MSQKKERLEKMTASLTPQQAVLVWMEEVHRSFPNIRGLALSLRGQRTSAFPLSRLQEQVVHAVEAATKGQPKPAVARALRQALRDMYFFYHLHSNANFRVAKEMAVWMWQIAALSERLQAMDTEDFLRRFIGHVATIFSMDMPYPVDPRMAGTIETAIKHHVTTWEQLDEDGTIATWVSDRLVRQGSRDIPGDAYRHEGVKCIPTVGPDNETAVRSCFKDGAQFELFRAGDDYTNGLADVTDAEFGRHYDSVVSGMREMVISGQVQAGKAIVLETVPIPFLRESPLVDGQWLDRHVAELAQLGMLLRKKGYRAGDDDDGHPLSSGRIFGDDGQEADINMIASAAKTAADNLAKFEGWATDIGRRPYLHCEEYCAWQRRRAKGDLPPTMCEGLVTSSWNAWVEKLGGEGRATVAGVPVERLSCPVERHHYQVCPAGAEAMLDSRKQILGLMRRCQSESERDAQERADWESASENYLVELHSLREGLSQLSRRCFAGQPVLFSDATVCLDQLIATAEELAARFNSEFGKHKGSVVDEGLHLLTAASAPLRWQPP